MLKMADIVGPMVFDVLSKPEYNETHAENQSKRKIKGIH